MSVLRQVIMTARRWCMAGGLWLLLVSEDAQAQSPPRVLTADDYARAERFLSYHTAPLVLNAGVRVTWLPDGRFWYRTTRAPLGRHAVLPSIT
jgi:hypothetical protein